MFMPMFSQLCKPAAVLSAALLFASPAGAESHSSGEGHVAKAETMAAEEGRADRITCADLIQMDSATVPGTLYFVAGYGQGRKDAGASMDGSSSSVAGAAVEGTGGTTSEESASGDQAADQDGDAATGSSSGTASAGTGGTPKIRKISGFFEIPVEQITTICGETPDRSVSDVVEEQKGTGSQELN